MKVNSLSEKLILYFVLLGSFAIMIIGAVSFYSTKKALIARTYEQLTSLRIVKKNQVQQFYADRLRDIAFIAGSGNLASCLPLPNSPAGKLQIPLNQYFTYFYIVGGKGVLAQGMLNDEPGGLPPEIPTGVFQDLRSKTGSTHGVIFDVSRDARSGKPYQLIAAQAGCFPDARSGEPCILVLAISMTAIDAMMLNNDPKSGLGLSGETYLVGRDFLMRSTSRFRPNSILSTEVRTSVATRALAGEAGTMTSSDYRGVPVLSSFELLDIAGLKWAILAEIDVQEAMVPIYATRSRILLLSLIILLVFFGFVTLIARRITRPVIRLRDAAVNLGKGRFDAELPVETSDEIGALTESFNTMARQIKEKTTELQQERSGRMRSVFDGEEMERQRLSRELHDGIGQSLIAVKLRLENLLYLEGTETRNSIQELRKYFDQIIDEVRRISNNLMPSVLEVFSIPIAFRNLFAETEEHSSLKIYFEARGNFDDLDKKIKTYIYRLAQEALNNIVKHAEAREVRVELTRYPDHLTLVIRDDGKGFSSEQAMNQGGNGIHNMRERASLLKGYLEIDSAPSKGTSIHLNVPIIIANVKDPDFPRG